MWSESHGGWIYGRDCFSCLRSRKQKGSMGRDQSKKYLQGHSHDQVLPPSRPYLSVLSPPPSNAIYEPIKGWTYWSDWALLVGLWNRETPDKHFTNPWVCLLHPTQLTIKIKHHKPVLPSAGYKRELSWSAQPVCDLHSIKAEEGDGLTLYEMPKVSSGATKQRQTHPELSLARDTRTEMWLRWVLRARSYLACEWVGIMIS